MLMLAKKTLKKFILNVHVREFRMPGNWIKCVDVRICFNEEQISNWKSFDIRERFKLCVDWILLKTVDFFSKYDP